MKKWYFLLALGLGLASFKYITDVPKYKVELSVEQWSKNIAVIQGLQQLAGDGNAKYSDVVFLKKEGDSVINTIILQVQPQLPKDTTKPKK